jgi:hypothetical protein
LFGSTGIYSVSLWLESREQTLVFSPAFEQVGAVVTVQPSHWWVWAGGCFGSLFFAGISDDKVSQADRDRAAMINTSAVEMAINPSVDFTVLVFFIKNSFVKETAFRKNLIEIRY